MSAHRYWRATAFEAYGAGDLELSEFHLLAGGVRVDATATLTASVAPDVSGVLANLQDDVLSTSARWTAQAVEGLTLQWDFGGSTADVGGIRLSGDCEWRFLLIASIKWSDDAVTWSQLQLFSGIGWPGAGVFTTSTEGSSGYVDPSVSLLVHFDGDFSDFSKNPKSPIVTGALSAYGPPKFGLGSMQGGALKYVAYPAHIDFELGVGDFCIEAQVLIDKFTASGLQGVVNIGAYNNGILIRLNQTFIACFFNGTEYQWSYTPTLGDFRHLAVTREDGTLRAFYGGVRLNNDKLGVTGSIGFLGVHVGTSQHSGTEFVDGLIDELQIRKGEAGYTADFIPPTTAFMSFSPPVLASLLQNTVRGRVASPDSNIIYGTPAPNKYGDVKAEPPEYLSIESGSVKDQITGVLGEGIGRVKGTVATKGSPNQPVHRKVRLIRERDGLVIRESWSNAATGEYDFQWVDEAQSYTVVSYDYLHNYRAVIADNLVPELMP